MVSSKVISDECPFYEPAIHELTLPMLMVFLRKYMAGALLQCLVISSICTLIILSPLARFYITENIFSGQVMLFFGVEQLWLWTDVCFLALMNLVNDWLLFLLLFLFCSTYLSLARVAKLSVVKVTFMFHVLIEALTVGVVVIYTEMLYVYQGILLATVCFFCLFLYTMQSKWNFNIVVPTVIYFLSSFVFCTINGAVFGVIADDLGLSMIWASFIVFYHVFFIAYFAAKFTADESFCAIVNAHTFPINACIYSSPIRKPLK